MKTKSRNIFQITLMSLVVSSCGGGGDSSSAPVTDTVRIVGAWEFLVSDVQCLDTTVYREGGTFRVESLDEIQTGKYSFTSPNNGDVKYSLTMTWESDNQLSDCLGDTSDSTGVTQLFYVEFPSDTEMNVYGGVSGGSILGVLSKSS